MARLILDYPDDMTTHEAISLVLDHVKEGKISQAAGIPHFCWITSFRDTDICIATRRKKAGQKSDSLIVYREPSHGTST